MIKKIHTFKFLIILLLAACGGGGSSQSDPVAPTPAPTRYTVTISAGEGGSTAQSSYSVIAGNTLSFNISVEDTYVISNAQGCGGELNGNNYTTSAINANCEITISFRRGYSLPASIENDWIDYDFDLRLIESSRTETYRLGINLDQIWFKSLQIPSTAFSTRKEKFDTEFVHEPGIGYGHTLNIDDNKQIIFASDWQCCRWWNPEVEENGNAYLIEFIDGEPARFNSRKITGSSKPKSLKNYDGTHSIIFPGHDEGPLFYPDQTDKKAATISYEFNLDDFNWSIMDEIGKIAAHGTYVHDFDQDGDDDLFASTWGGDYQGKGIIFKNNNAVFEAIPIKSQVAGWSAVAAFHDERGDLGVILLDTLWFGGQWEEEIEQETNVIAYFDNGMSMKNTRFKELPQGYFMREEFDGLPNKFTDGLHRSHDLHAGPADIDNDGDIDILISSMIYGAPATVLQILVNHDGEYVDETDSRLFNWLLHAENYLGDTASHHILTMTDINNDGFIDAIVTDGSGYTQGENRTNTQIGSRMLLNDGDGHFVVIAYQQIDIPSNDKPRGPYIFSKSNEGAINWFHIFPGGCGGTTNSYGKCINLDIIDIDNNFSTGPNGVDPEQYGAPGFNEFYYILHNEVVRNALTAGTYTSGLDHYLAEGKDMGLKINAL